MAGLIEGARALADAWLRAEHPGAEIVHGEGD